MEVDIQQRHNGTTNVEIAERHDVVSDGFVHESFLFPVSLPLHPILKVSRAVDLEERRRTIVRAKWMT
jgi:hypothetical protein